MKDKSYKPASSPVDVRNALCDSRHKILETLKRKKSTVEDLSEFLSISPTAVRQHLTILEGDSLVKGEPIKGGMGRPKYIYSLTVEAEDFFPKKYHMLAEALIGEIAGEGEEKLKRIIRNISIKSSESYKKEAMEKPMAERMIILQRAFEKNMGYVDISRERKGYRLTKYNCPLHLISSKYPIVCEIDFNLIKTISGVEVVHEKCMAKKDEYCLFRIG